MMIWRALVLAVAGLVLTAHAAVGAFTDTAGYASSSFTAAVLDAPSAVTCDGSTDAITWTAPDVAVTGYEVVVSVAGVVEATLPLPADATSWQPTGSLLTLNTYSVRIRAVFGDWESPLSASANILVVSVLTIGLIVSC